MAKKIRTILFTQVISALGNTTGNLKSREEFTEELLLRLPEIISAACAKRPSNESWQRLLRSAEEIEASFSQFRAAAQAMGPIGLYWFNSLDGKLKDSNGIAASEHIRNLVFYLSKHIQSQVRQPGRQNNAAAHIALFVVLVWQNAFGRLPGYTKGENAFVRVCEVLNVLLESQGREIRIGPESRKIALRFMKEVIARAPHVNGPISLEVYRFTCFLMQSGPIIDVGRIKQQIASVSP